MRICACGMWGKALQSQTVVQITTNISYLIGKIHKHSQNADEGAGSCPATWKRGPAWQRGAGWALLLSHGAVLCFCHKATLSVELRLRGDNSIFGAGMAGKTQLQLVALALSPRAFYSPRRKKKTFSHGESLYPHHAKAACRGTAEIGTCRPRSCRRSSRSCATLREFPPAYAGLSGIWYQLQGAGGGPWTVHGRFCSRSQLHIGRFCH